MVDAKDAAHPRISSEAAALSSCWGCHPCARESPLLYRDLARSVRTHTRLLGLVAIVVAHLLRMSVALPLALDAGSHPCWRLSPLSWRDLARSLWTHCGLFLALLLLEESTLVMISLRRSLCCVGEVESFGTKGFQRMTVVVVVRVSESFRISTNNEVMGGHRLKWLGGKAAANAACPTTREF